MEIADTLAKRVKLARTALKMTQEALAKKSGLKQSDLSKIESGRILRTTGIVALARALKADVDWLADGIGNVLPDGSRQTAPSQPDEISPAHAMETIVKLLSALSPEAQPRVASLMHSMALDPAGPWKDWVVEFLETAHESTDAEKSPAESATEGPNPTKEPLVHVAVSNPEKQPDKTGLYALGEVGTTRGKKTNVRNQNRPISKPGNR